MTDTRGRVHGVKVAHVAAAGTLYTGACILWYLTAPGAVAIYDETSVAGTDVGNLAAAGARGTGTHGVPCAIGLHASAAATVVYTPLD